MKRTTPLLLLALLSCAPATPPPAAAPPIARAASAARPQRVVLISFDGLGADALARQGGLASFERLAREGASARVVPVNPTATVPAHVALLTGARPQKTGIVANRYHVPGTPPDLQAMGMESDPDVETLVEAARRQGKRVGAVTFPTVDGRTPRRTADFGLAWTEPLVQGKVITLAREDFKREWVPPTWTPRPQRHPSFSPVMRARIEWAVPSVKAIDVDLVAYDRTDDGQENYDAIYLESGDFEAAPDPSGWFPISMRLSGVVHGSWSKILRADPKLAEVVVYWGPVGRTEAYPEAFRSIVEEEAGFWPGEPDPKLDPQTYVEQLRRMTEFFTNAQTAALRRMPFDLLLLYQPGIDEASHTWLGSNDAVVREAFLAADRAAGALLALLDPARDALLVTGDHGLTVRQRDVRVNRLLADAGLFPQWRAFVTGHVAHLYGQGDADEVVKLLTATGYFELVEKKSAASHRNSGDVVAYAFPMNALSASAEPPAVVERSGGGAHGALNTHRELHTVLFAVGAGTPKGPLGEIAQTSIARYVSSLLGIAPPAAAE